MYLQDLIFELSRFWSEAGCVIEQPIDVEVGAGTFHHATFLRCLGPEPWNTAFVQRSRRPVDGRYGENPNRLGLYFQYQIGLKPAPPDCQELYLDMLRHIGLDPLDHDIRFVEDDWESPTLGAWGLGWEVWSDGMEITQFTYFQQAGGLDLAPITCELTLGLERIAMYLQNVESFRDLQWNKDVKYGEMFMQSEVEYSRYSFEQADVALCLELFDKYESECERLLDAGLVLPAYDFALKGSHTFNVLDARGAISVTERQRYIGRVRNLSRRCAEGYVEARAGAGFPLLGDAGAAVAEAYVAARDGGKKTSVNAGCVAAGRAAAGEADRAA